MLYSCHTHIHPPIYYLTLHSNHTHCDFAVSASICKMNITQLFNCGTGRTLCPHARFWRQLLRYQVSIWQLVFPEKIYSSEEEEEHRRVPDCLQISSAKDDDMDPNHPTSPTAAWFTCWCGWASAGNKLLNHLPSLKGHQGGFSLAAGHRSITVSLRYAFKGTVHHIFQCS